MKQGEGRAGKGRDWAAYYRKTGERPPRETLLLALDRFDAEPVAGGEPRLAVDLGCGGGRDVVELLRRGWRVLAIDAEAAAIDHLRGRADIAPDAPLDTQVARFEDAVWPAADLVNSSFALPLCPPDRFDAVWARILASLKPGGRFSGQLYGMRDSWVGRPGMVFVDRDRLDALLAGLDIEMLDEEEENSTTPRGEPKHWHVYHIVARKPLP
jgi:SAM-dependent methyltransferase